MSVIAKLMHDTLARLKPQLDELGIEVDLRHADDIMHITTRTTLECKDFMRLEHFGLMAERLPEYMVVDRLRLKLNEMLEDEARQKRIR